jgi:hypothetical protein
VDVAQRIRSHLRSQHIPVVGVCDLAIPEGSEIEVGSRIYLTFPDDFNQLRRLLHRVAIAGPEH